MGVRRHLERGLNAIWYGGSWLRFLLWPLSALFRFAVACRRIAYRHGLVKSANPGVAVVVIGNISIGGTGKTPLTIWLAERLAERKYRVGVIASGYGGEASDWPRRVTADDDAALVGDEAALLARRLDCPVIAGPDRVAAAKRLLDEAQLDVILSDDGLQHYRLARDAEVAVIDGTRGFGNGHCLPAGPLREPPSRLREVDAVVINGGDFEWERSFRAEMSAVRVVEVGGKEVRDLEEFRDQRVHAVAAIGNPERFFGFLEDAGLDVDPRAFADHARIGSQALRFDDDDPILITEKDAVKCSALDIRNLWCVVTEFAFAPGHGERLLRTLTPLIDRVRS